MENLPKQPDKEQNEIPQKPSKPMEAVYFEMRKDKDQFSEKAWQIFLKWTAGEKITPEEQSTFDSARNEWWQEKYGFSFQNKQKRLEVLADKYNAKKIQEAYFVKELGVDKSLIDLLRSIKKVNKQLAEIDKPSIVGEEEIEQITINTSKKGWLGYWMDRLESEFDSMPDSVTNAIVKLLQGEVPEDEESDELKLYMDIKRGLEEYNEEGRIINDDLFSTFQNHINERVAALKFELRKKVEMAKLKKRLHDIDEKKNYTPEEMRGRRKVFYDEEGDYLYTSRNSQRRVVTYGDITADYEWGIKYAPDPSLPPDIWRRIRKLSDVTETRKNIEEIFDQELSELESVFRPPAIKTIVQQIEEGEGKGPGFGFVAEYMAKNLLLRLQYDSDKFEMRVEPSNALEDTELKYDFKVIVPTKTQGVAIEGDDLPRKEYVAQKRKIGVQFTINSSLSKKKEKVATGRKRVKEHKYKKFVKRQVDDIVLVSLPMDAYSEAFYEWISAEKPPGGPEQFLLPEEKKRILKTVMQELPGFDDKIIDEIEIL